MISPRRADSIRSVVSSVPPSATVHAWRIATAALVIFAAGVLTGGVSAELVSWRLRGTKPAGPAGHRMSDGLPSNSAERVLPAVRLPGAARLELAEKLSSELDLTPDQKTEFLKALAETQGRLAKIWNPVIPAAKSEVEQFHRRLAEILTPEQKAKLDRLTQRRGGAPEPAAR